MACAGAAELVHRFRHENPVDFEGTYPLPEAQLDRFLLKIRVAYPSELKSGNSGAAPCRLGAGLLEDAKIAPIPDGLLAAACAEVRAIRIEPELYNYIWRSCGARGSGPRCCWRKPSRGAECDARGAGGGSFR